MAATREYRAPEICRMTGITYRQIDFWARTGILVPSIEDANGSGTRRRYSETDLRALKAIKLLLDGGLSLQSARWVGTLVASIGLDAAGFIVITGDRAHLALTSYELAECVGQGQVAHVLALDVLEQS